MPPQLSQNSCLFFDAAEDIQRAPFTLCDWSRRQNAAGNRLFFAVAMAVPTLFREAGRPCFGCNEPKTYAEFQSGTVFFGDKKNGQIRRKADHR